MKHHSFLFKVAFPALLSLGSLTFGACNNTAAPASGTDTTTAKPASVPAENAAPDYHGYAQYLRCSINGQPYLAYVADGHTTAITNPVNMPGRTDFTTSADEEKINGATKMAEMHFLFFDLGKKGVGTYTSTKEFTMDGHTAFPEGAGLKDVHFVVADGQQLAITSIKDEIIEGTFTFDAVDEKDKSRVLKITGGEFKLKANGGVKSLKTDANGDVDVNKIIKDATK